MNDLRIFNFEGSDVRSVILDNETWWVLKDVCGILELSNARVVADRLDDDEVRKLDLLGQVGEVNIINESGLYSVILRSDKPNAKPFRKWVTSEVLPSIRKTGGYNIDNAFNSLKASVDEIKARLDATLTPPSQPSESCAKEKVKAGYIFKEYADSGFVFEFTQGDVNSTLKLIDEITDKQEPLFTYNCLLRHTKLSPLELQYMLKCLIRIKKIRIFDQLRSDSSVLIQYIRRG